MQTEIQRWIVLLKAGDLDALQQDYKTSTEAQNISQLAFLFQQGQTSDTGFEYYQKLATQLIEQKALPSGLIRQINTHDRLSFFTPALQLTDNFKQTDQEKKNVLHYLFLGLPSEQAQSQPAFNYLRAMMLFESNEDMHDALCQRDQQGLTPVESYLAFNSNLAVLPAHEFTALMALIEIESKQQPIEPYNVKTVFNSVKTLCKSQSQQLKPELQRLVLVASYYKKSVSSLL